MAYFTGIVVASPERVGRLTGRDPNMRPASGGSRRGIARKTLSAPQAATLCR